jgi:pyruvate/2-oxoglutarate dehydrogenase complex dihydrolipoamide dehydrogenase (E3) component
MKDQLLSKINTHTARIAIIGLGYVGLPLAVAFAEAGFPVSHSATLRAGIGIDADVNTGLKLSNCWPARQISFMSLGMRIK